MMPRYSKEGFVPKISQILIVVLVFVGLTALFYALGSRLQRLVLGAKQSVASTAGRTNFLLLGVPGEAYSGQDLTDTLIFFSLDQSSGESWLLSLPRDIWIAAMRAKLNTVYHYAEKNQPGSGLAESKKVVGEILGQPIHYAVLLDFGGFRQVIDTLGGVPVDVERAFDDYRYPITGKENDECSGDSNYQCRYEHLHFEKGLQLMDGERALKYVRSRFAEGEEGTDFARSRRQQQIITAIRKKLLSWETLRDGKRLRLLYEVFNQSIKTDVPPSAYFGLAQLALQFKTANIKTAGLEDLLVNPPASTQYDFQWVLMPRTDWSEIHRMVVKRLTN